MTLPPPPTPSPEWAWFFDIDGTLLELSLDRAPGPIRPQRHLPDALAPLYRRVGGAMALISGRSIASMQQILAPMTLPISGCHGSERRLADGNIERLAPLPEMERARRMLTQFAARHEGLLFEDKELALALSYRLAPHLEAACRAAVEAAVSGDLGWYPGKMVYEIHSRNHDKGRALRALMDTPPFRGRKPIFLGDDLPDEYAFDAARSLGGLAVLVGPLRATRAMFQLESVSAVYRWLTPLCT